MQEKTPSPSSWHGMADFLRHHRDELVLDWEQALAARHPDGLLNEPLLRDALPGYLERLADALEHPPSEPSSEPHGLPLAVTDEHWLRRLESGLEPGEVLVEFGLLRHCLHQGLAREGVWASLDEWAVLNASIDQGMVDVTTRCMGVRERMLEALERVSEVALESQEIGTFLPRLLQVLQEAAVSVDGASILLNREGALQVASAVGIGARHALAAGLSLPLDRGLSGQVARGYGPRLVRMASSHPDLGSEFVRQLGVRALYSIPLRHGERLIGVAHMSSRTLFDFSPGDKLLFRTLMRRATAFIVQTELAEAEHHARTRAQHLLTLVDTLVEACPVGLCLLDRELRFLCINNTLAQINGHPVAEHLGHALRDRVPAWAVEVLEPRFREVLARGEPVSNHEFSSPPRPDQDEQHWLGHYYPVRSADGEVDGLGCVLVNITRHKQVEAELRRASALREQVIGVVGHDLRNPLSAIGVSAALLRRDPALSPGSQRAVERIRTSAARMARMINDLLDFARGNAHGGLPVRRERMNLHALCREALDELQVAYGGRRLELATQGDGWGWWDPDRLTQLLGNLVSNALQHGHEETPVRVEVRDEGGGGVALAVHNEGRTISPELLDTLFEPFRHGPMVRGGPRGVGLGLYIVRQISRAHGGDARVDSSADGHTVFTVTLPRGDADDAPGAQRP